MGFDASNSMPMAEMRKVALEKKDIKMIVHSVKKFGLESILKLSEIMQREPKEILDLYLNFEKQQNEIDKSEAAPKSSKEESSRSEPKEHRYNGSEKSIKSLWSANEDDQLAQLVNKYGRRWELVAARLPGRSKHACKQRFYHFYEKESTQRAIQHLEKKVLVLAKMALTKPRDFSEPIIPMASPASSFENNSELLSWSESESKVNHSEEFDLKRRKNSDEQVSQNSRNFLIIFNYSPSANLW